MFAPDFGQWGRRLLVGAILCACCGGAFTAAFAAENPDLQRARQLREKQRSGQVLTAEEKVFLNGIRESLRRGRAEESAAGSAVGQDGPGATATEPKPFKGGATYYIAINGSDNNSGSADSPWASISYALTKLAPADTLNLRAGTYYELGLANNVQGTASHTITIQSFPGEHAIIDGGTPHFMGLNHEEWILHNPAIDEYRSARAFSGDYVRIWLADERMQIFRYRSAANLESTNYGPLNGSIPVYFGPGAQLRADGHIYLRLSPNPNDQFDSAQRPISPVPADVDPNHHRLAVSVARNIGGSVIFDGVLQHVIFRNLTLAHAKTLFDLKPGSHHVAFVNSVFLYGTYGINCRARATDLEITGCIFDNQVPYFLYWTDVKNEARETAEGYPDFQSTAVVGFSSNTQLRDNIFENGFDGFQADGGVNIRVLNNQFCELHDDAMNFQTGTSGEAAHNLMWHVDSGIALLGSGTPAGEMFIHHNVIDTTALRHGGRAGNYRADVWPVWNTDTPFAKHGGGNRAARWKLYNNTIIARAVPYHTPMNPFALENNAHFYAVNNIFYAVDDRVIYRDHRTARGGVYDGNILWQGRSGGTLFMYFGDGGTYRSLADFQARHTGWEEHGRQIDPGFDLAEINRSQYAFPDILERYRPSNPACGEIGFSYQGVDWPETLGVSYTGALPPLDRH